VTQSTASADALLRQELLQRLSGRGAHMPFEEAVKDFPVERINDPFPNGSYSAWGLIEHLRITQWDILDYIRNPNYQHMEWPKDYWPPERSTASSEDWSKTVEAFLRDKAELAALVESLETDLTAEIPWGNGHTILREVLLVCDHNAYHIGEFAIIRQVMGTWRR
jgi:hypothetical protein